MTNPAAAFQATIHGFRTIPSRGVLQVTIEAPIEEHARIAEIAQHGAWVAVARLEKKPTDDSSKYKSSHVQFDYESSTKPKSYAQEAGKWCADPEFQKFIGAANGSIAADIVRETCGVQSRKEILEGTIAAAKWSDIMARFEIERRT